MTEPQVPATPDPLEPPAAPEAQTPDNDPSTLPQWARDAITKANKEAANYRTQVAELKPKADQFARLEDSMKSDQQRLEEAAARAAQEAEQARADAVRYKVAATYGIGADHFDLLGAGDEATVAARAEKISALLAAQAAATQTPPPPGPPPGRRVEQLRPGATPGEPVDEDEQVWQSLFGANGPTR